MIRYISTFLFFMLWFSSAMAVADESNSGRLTGAWIPRKIGPISGGIIYVFNTKSGPAPQANRFFRRIPDAVEKTNKDGKFSIPLEEGTYNLSLQKKADSDVPGPPKDGDLSGLVRDKNGLPVNYIVKKGKTTHIGTLRQATIYKAQIIKSTSEMTAITGVVKAISGSPLSDAVVLAYDNPNIMGRPKYISQKTGKDGKYLIQVDLEGTYYVTIRAAKGGGRPQSGDISGSYGGEVAQPVTVSDHKITAGIDIQTVKFVDNRPATDGTI